jgi:hypothetical protein
MGGGTDSQTHSTQGGIYVFLKILRDVFPVFYGLCNQKKKEELRDPERKPESKKKRRKEKEREPIRRPRARNRG